MRHALMRRLKQEAVGSREAAVAQGQSRELLTHRTGFDPQRRQLGDHRGCSQEERHRASNPAPRVRLPLPAQRWGVV